MNNSPLCCETNNFTKNCKSEVFNLAASILSILFNFKLNIFMYTKSSRQRKDSEDRQDLRCPPVNPGTGPKGQRRDRGIPVTISLNIPAGPSLFRP